VQDDALRGSGIRATVDVLVAALRKISFDLLFTGADSSDGLGGIVGAPVAARLGLPYLSYASEIEPSADGTSVTVQRLSAGGYDVLTAPLPAVVMGTQLLGEPRYPSLRGIMQARSKETNTWSLAERGLAFASSARRRSEVVLSKVSVSAADITLSGTAGKLPLSIKNESGKTLQVVVITRGGHATFPGGPRMRVTLRPADNYVTIPVDLGRGNIYDRVTVSIIAGDVRLATTRLAVRASYLDRIAIVAMVVAVLAGLLFYIRRKVRRAEADT
jgi:hypothetical protein